MVGEPGVPAAYQDDWLMEALANYSSLMLLEKRKGRKALEEVLDEYRAASAAERPKARRSNPQDPLCGVRA